MLEAYTTLGFLAAHTTRAKLLTVVTGVHYRTAGLLAKTITTLDVLSGGRAWLGIGAGWNEEESLGLGFGFPPVATRFELLEETLQICLQMWRGDETPYEGKHYQLHRAAQLAAVADPAAPADHDRWRRREEDAAAGREVRRRLQPVRHPRRRRTSSTSSRSTASARAATTTTIYKTAYYLFDTSAGRRQDARRPPGPRDARIPGRDRRGPRRLVDHAARDDRPQIIPEAVARLLPPRPCRTGYLARPEHLARRDRLASTATARPG